MDLLTANDQLGAYPSSWYAATADVSEPSASLSGNLTCDVCVVGGGFTGLSAALHLAQRGYDVVLLEAQRVGFGASGRNGGQVSGGQRLEQDELEAMMGRQTAHDLWGLSQASVELVHSLARDHCIDYDWVPGVIHADHRARFVAHSHANVDKLRDDYGYTQIEKLDREDIRARVGSNAYHGGSVDYGSGHIHPLKFALGLARAAQAAGVRIFEQSRVTEIKRGDPAVVRTLGGAVTARYVVLGANGYLGGLERDVAARVMPINNYIVATKPLSEDLLATILPRKEAVADSKFVINYFRLSADNRMLFGGGETYGYKFPAKIDDLVRPCMAEIYPQLAEEKIDYAWGGTLAITLNRMPHFERLSGNILSMSGYSGHGVAMATLAGQLASEAIAGQAERFDLMAKVPTPKFPGGAILRSPLLVLGMLWFSLRDRL